MANRYFPSRPQFFDATPNVRAGGKLFFYVSGTSTPKDTFSDEDLSSANTNPVVLNSLGQPDNPIWLSDAPYKVKLTDADGVEVWTDDPVYTSDYSTVAKVRAISGSPNGVLAGTAGSVGIPADMAWDFVGNILYICTSTGTAVTAVWTSVNSGSAASIVPTPQGRLTLASGTPAPTGDVTGASTVYYTPYVGGLVPVYNGASLVPLAFSELSLALVSAHASNTNYDVFVFNNSGAVTLVSGPAWTSDTGRGTGAGTTELARIDGIRVNAVAMTGRNGSTTYSIAANRATYLGTFRTVAAAGTTDDSAVKRLVWNAYNRVPRAMLRVETTANWNYSTATFRQANNAAANQLAILIGEARDAVECTVMGQAFNSTSTPRGVLVGMGLDSTSVNSASLTTRADCTDTIRCTPIARYIGYPGLGYHTLVWLERGHGSDTQTWFGDDTPALPGIIANVLA